MFLLSSIPLGYSHDFMLWSIDLLLEDRKTIQVRYADELVPAVKNLVAKFGSETEARQWFSLPFKPRLLLCVSLFAVFLLFLLFFNSDCVGCFCVFVSCVVWFVFLFSFNVMHIKFMNAMRSFDRDYDSLPFFNFVCIFSCSLSCVLVLLLLVCVLCYCWGEGGGFTIGTTDSPTKAPPVHCFECWHMCLAKTWIRLSYHMSIPSWCRPWKSRNFLHWSSCMTRKVVGNIRFVSLFVWSFFF